MRRFILLGLILVFFTTACSAFSQQAEVVEEEGLVTIFALDGWGCCGDWTDYLEENGYQTVTTEYASLDQIKKEYQVPEEFQTCHTAIVNGYVIEGHVPVEEIERLLSEKPDVIGIAVAGMPMGSPGMEIEGFEDEAFDVVTFDAEGVIEIYQSYPGK
jgi:hypothetical protein